MGASRTWRSRRVPVAHGRTACRGADRSRREYHTTGAPRQPSRRGKTGDRPGKGEFLPSATLTGVADDGYSFIVARSAVVTLLGELWAFMRVRKKWWLGPIVLVLVLFGALLVFSQGSALAPFVYTLF